MKRRIIKAIGLLILLFTLCALFSLTAGAMTDDGKVVIVIDPGHGGNDPGAVNGKVYESTNALIMANKMKTILEDTGKFMVYLTRTDNSYMLRYPRAEIADRYNADFCISLHFNSSTNQSLHGASVLASVKDAYYKKQLCKDILTNLNSSLGLKNNGITRLSDYGTTVHYWSDKYKWDIPYSSDIGPATDYYGLINWCSKFGIPSVIVEHCFISNSAEVKLIKDESSLAKMAKADAKALIAYYTNHEHTFTSERVTDYPTSCALCGKASYHCTVCGARKSVKKLADAPDPEKHCWYLNDYKKPTCTKEGLKTYVCAYRQSLVESYIKSDPHSYTEVVPATGHDYKVVGSEKAGHAKDGYKIYRCTKCGDEYTETLPRTDDHVFKEVSRTEASCTVEGSVEYACEKCGEKKTEKIPTSDAHKYEKIEEKAAGCTADGVIRKRCRLCGAETEEVLPAVGHTFKVTESRKASCTESGLTVEKCSRCGEEKREETAPLGHQMEERQDGERVWHVCSVCGYSSDKPAETLPPETAAPVTDPPEKASASETDGEPGEEQGQTTEKMILYLILIGIIVLAGGGILVLVLSGRKKKHGDPFKESRMKDQWEEEK